MGYPTRIVSIDHVDDLRSEVAALRDDGRFNRALYDEYERPFIPEVPKYFRGARSLAVVAVSQPMLRVTFHHQGKALQLIVPPTYFDFGKAMWRVRRALREAARPGSYRFVKAFLPAKLLAVRSGLALYGRNNITYVPGFGSFHRLAAFYTDYETSVDDWRDAESLPKCGKCRACIDACPTGSIQKDRFLIRAERCVTYHNEKPSDTRFPGWIDPSAHNCLVGCMKCQIVCPYNADRTGWYEDRGEFSEQDTKYILAGRFSGQRAAAMDRRLNEVGLELALFPRNLEALIDE